jgi:hypothetical protein
MTIARDQLFQLSNKSLTLSSLPRTVYRYPNFKYFFISVCGLEPQNLGHLPAMWITAAAQPCGHGTVHGEGGGGGIEQHSR